MLQFQTLGGGFRWKSEYPWCVIRYRGNKLTFSNSFQKNRENQKKMMENGNFYTKPVFDQIG
ncbi:Uncharacterized protein FWK35_00035407 [Aphis craccivora]|uniref:Uncharacterized protein n=1 Tax=Aphis craccivora TaxID=307492 RepID=A0A6G0YRE8_APHCR|nr:Uncharacterized protein FWK35_00035407 [Aphis craccivora]